MTGSLQWFIHVNVKMNWELANQPQVTSMVKWAGVFLKRQNKLGNTFIN